MLAITDGGQRLQVNASGSNSPSRSGSSKGKSKGKGKGKKGSKNVQKVPVPPKRVWATGPNPQNAYRHRDMHIKKCMSHPIRGTCISGHPHAREDLPNTLQHGRNNHKIAVEL